MRLISGLGLAAVQPSTLSTPPGWGDHPDVPSCGGGVYRHTLQGHGVYKVHRYTVQGHGVYKVHRHTVHAHT